MLAAVRDAAHHGCEAHVVAPARDHEDHVRIGEVALQVAAARLDRGQGVAARWRSSPARAPRGSPAARAAMRRATRRAAFAQSHQRDGARLRVRRLDAPGQAEGGTLLGRRRSCGLPSGLAALARAACRAADTRAARCLRRSCSGPRRKDASTGPRSAWCRRNSGRSRDRCPSPRPASRRRRGCCRPGSPWP